jgi:hypothetical protein
MEDQEVSMIDLHIRGARGSKRVEDLPLPNLGSHLDEVSAGTGGTGASVSSTLQDLLILAFTITNAIEWCQTNRRGDDVRYWTSCLVQVTRLAHALQSGSSSQDEMEDWFELRKLTDRPTGFGLTPTHP